MTESAVHVHFGTTCSGAIRSEWHEAVSQGDSELVAHFLETNPALIEEDKGANMTALHLAVIKGHHKVVTQLLAAGCMVNAIDGCGNTALHNAVSDGDEKIVAELLADPRTEVGARDKRQSTALHLAVWLRHDGVVAQLLADSRTPINAEDSRGWTALHYAALGDGKVVAQLLADSRGVSVNAREKSGCCTALQLAAKGGKAKAAALLLAQDSIEIDDVKPLLQLVARTGSEELLPHLQAKCPLEDILAWVNSVDDPRRNMFHFAIDKDWDKIGAQLLALSPALLDTMLFGRNPLQVAVGCAAEKFVFMLLDAKPELISTVDKDNGNTVLHLAAQKSSLSQQTFARLWQLCRSSNDVRTPNKYGVRPLCSRNERKMTLRWT